MKTMLIAATAALAGSAALAQTATPPVPASPQHPMADKVMTRTEVVEKVRGHFSRFDTDKDGSINIEEMGSFRGRMGSREMADGARPHVMMREGPIRDPNAAFDRLDANKDGMISRDEFAQGREQRIEKRIVMREKLKDARKDGKLGEMRMHCRGGMGGARMIVMADSDRDGRITLGEAEAMALKHFDEIDTNHDGQVTPDERGQGRRIIIKEIRKEAPDAG